MGVFESIIALATSIFNRVAPDRTKAQEQQFILEMQKALAESDLLKGQIDVNKAEALNPNRKWVTWRELLGYILVTAVGWQWVGLPLVSFLLLVSGNPVEIDKLPNIEILDMLYIMLGMLGLDASPIIAGRLRGGIKK